MPTNASNNPLINEKDINKLLEHLENMHQTQQEFQFIKTIIDVRSAEMQSGATLKLQESIESFSRENKKLSGRIFVLNYLVAVATVVLAIIGLLNFFYNCL